MRCRVRAPAERGRANAALLALLARELGLVRSALAITAGAASRRKRVLVRGLPPRELAARLRRPPRR
ncbi:MAG: hypothetical protein KatS3mg102_1054 [Planctomycetota bacterium]|nr:MAG: hypothetical protein KatS3mg102_1054 [Planctomycetota bacterium]